MSALFKSCFRLGVLLTVAGFVVGFMRLTDLALSFVLLAFAAVYLGWSVWTANKSSGYEHPRECFADILGDIFTYSWLLAGLCFWLLAPKHLAMVQSLPINHYWILTAFLGAMIGVTLIEMLITVHTCLIAMWRQNPITITR